MNKLVLNGVWSSLKINEKKSKHPLFSKYILIWLYTAKMLTPGRKDVCMTGIRSRFSPVYFGLPVEFCTCFYISQFYKCPCYSKILKCIYLYINNFF